MNQTFVALDVETTGLDPSEDAITEVAAIRFHADGTELATFESLVDPGRPIPAFVESLTGISSGDVKGAPRIEDIGQKLLGFAGDDPVVGHNIEFDLQHLREAGFSLPGPPVDTATLSRVLLPTAESHSLGAVADELGVEPTTSHRALADARTAAAVLVGLLTKAAALPTQTRNRLASLADSESPILAELLAGEEWKHVDSVSALPVPTAWSTPPPLERIENASPTDPDLSVAALRSAGRVLPDFEDRPEQLTMAEAAAAAFASGGHWLMEAGTGVGKTLAYLVPAAINAIKRGERIVVSTNTIALQEQLFAKDIPALRAILQQAGIIANLEDLRVSVLKGRDNYLCYRRWIAAQASVAEPDLAELMARILLWLPDTATGDRTELNLSKNVRGAWSQLSAQDADCLARPNRHVLGGSCFLARARREAEAAHILVINHALLLADIASNGSAIPSFEHLVIDEAHNLEAQATREFGRNVSRQTVSDVVAGFWRGPGTGNRTGGIATLLEAFPDGLARNAGNAIAQAARNIDRPSEEFFSSLQSLLKQDGQRDLLVTRGIRAGDAWAGVELAWGRLEERLRQLVENSELASEILQSTGEDGDEEDDLLASEVEGSSRRLADVRTAIDEIVSLVDDSQIVWMATDRRGGVSLNAAPLDVGPILSDQVMRKRRTVIATSATLDAGGSMGFKATRIGLPEAENLQVGSPFDYESAALVTEVTDVPEPRDAAYPEAVATTTATLVRASQGRALVLFTSHAALRAAANRVRDQLAEEDVAVLAQDIDGPPQELIRILRNRPRTALFGTASFWEGVDIRGEALSLLVIARLPFAVPTDPIHQARAAQYERAFGDYTLPGAILRFRQGFGRLIRHREDTGALAILDSRVFSRSYGPEFIRSLPNCSRYRGPTGAVATKIEEWLSR